MNRKPYRDKLLIIIALLISSQERENRKKNILKKKICLFLRFCCFSPMCFLFLQGLLCQSTDFMPYKINTLFLFRSLGDSARPIANTETSGFAFHLLPINSFSKPSLPLKDISCAQDKISCGTAGKFLEIGKAL